MIYGWYIADLINLFSGFIFSWLLASIMPLEIYSLISIAVAYSSIFQIFIRSNTVLIAYQAKNDKGLRNLYNSVLIRHTGFIICISILALIFIIFFKVKLFYFLLCTFTIDTANTLWAIKRFSLGRFKFGYLFSLLRISKLFVLLAGLTVINQLNINSSEKTFYLLLYSIISITPLLTVLSVKDLKIKNSSFLSLIFRTNFFSISEIKKYFSIFIDNLYINFKKSFKKSLKLLPQVWLGSYAIITLSYKSEYLDLISVVAVGKLVTGLSSTLFLAKVNSLLEKSGKEIVDDLNIVLKSRVNHCFKIIQYGTLISLLISVFTFIFKENNLFDILIKTNKNSAIELTFQNNYLLFIFLCSFLGVLLTVNAYLWNFYQTTNANSNISSLIIILNIVIFSCVIYNFPSLNPPILISLELISNFAIFTLFALGVPNKNLFKRRN